MVLKKTFGSGGRKEQDATLCMLRSFMIFTLQQVQSGWKNQGIWQGMSHARGRRERHKWFWVGNQKEDLDISMRVIFIFCWPCISVQFLLITDLTHFFNVFISLLYMFRATQCSSSGESVVSTHHLVYITPSHMQVREKLSDLHTRQPPTQSDIYIPDDVLIQLILLMMSTGLLETCREVK